MKERKENCQSFWEEKVRAIQKVRKSVKKTKKKQQTTLNIFKKEIYFY